LKPRAKRPSGGLKPPIRKSTTKKYLPMMLF
jgi:hypothetical protein